MDFDKEKFASLLLQAKGERSINRFGEEVDVSPAHISRLSRGKIDTPPSPETINKLSQGARNDVTYNELMLAAGHISMSSDSTDSVDEIIKPNLELEKAFAQIIVSELFQKDYEWTMEKSRGNGYNPDITIRLKNSDYSTWFIELKSWNTCKLNNIYQLYGQISTLDLTPDMKYTVAVDSINVFERILCTPPKLLKANIFLMLIDFKERKVTKEQRLCYF